MSLEMAISITYNPRHVPQIGQWMPLLHIFRIYLHTLRKPAVIGPKPYLFSQLLYRLAPPPGISKPCDLYNKNCIEPSLILQGNGIQCAPAAYSHDVYEAGAYGNTLFFCKFSYQDGWQKTNMIGFELFLIFLSSKCGGCNNYRIVLVLTQLTAISMLLSVRESKDTGVVSILVNIFLNKGGKFYNCEASITFFIFANSLQFICKNNNNLLQLLSLQSDNNKYQELYQCQILCGKLISQIQIQMQVKLMFKHLSHKIVRIKSNALMKIVLFSEESEYDTFSQSSTQSLAQSSYAFQQETNKQITGHSNIEPMLKVLRQLLLKSNDLKLADSFNCIKSIRQTIPEALACEEEDTVMSDSICYQYSSSPSSKKYMPCSHIYKTTNPQLSSNFSCESKVIKENDKYYYQEVTQDSSRVSYIQMRKRKRAVIMAKMNSIQKCLSYLQQVNVYDQSFQTNYRY